jgi:hypothetical protein
MSIRPIPLIVVALLASPPALALTTNPIDPSLPLDVHARASCLDGAVSYPDNVGNTMLVIDDDGELAICLGVVSQEDPATLTHLTGNASGRVDLEAGALKLSAIGRSYRDAQNALRVGAGGEVKLYDTLTVNGNWTGTRIIELRLTVHGSLTSNATSPNWQSSSVSSQLITLSEAGFVLGNAGVFVTQGNNGVPFITSSAGVGAIPPG